MKNVMFYKTDLKNCTKNAAGYYLGPVAPSACDVAALEKNIKLQSEVIKPETVVRGGRRCVEEKLQS